MTRVAIHQPNFLPYPGFFSKMLRADVFVLYDTAQFSRREYHNRNRIKTSQGVRWITVPVKVSGFPPIAAVDVDNAQDWQRKIWKSLEVNYGRAPYFDRYAPELKRLLGERHWARLADLNCELIGLLGKLLAIDTRLVLASELVPATDGDATEKLVNLVRAAGGDTYVSGPGGRHYLDKAKFGEVRLEYVEYTAVAYPQLWGAFVPNLCIVDALMNCGPKAWALLSPEEHPA